MARARKPGRITIGSRAVAVAILAEVLEQAAEEVIGDRNEPTMSQLADKLVGAAWDVEYKPTAERLIIVLDAGITSSDKMRSTPEDTATAPGESPNQCPYISNGKRCLRLAGHELEHDLED